MNCLANGIVFAVKIAKKQKTDKAKPRVIVGRLLTQEGGGPAAPGMARRGKPRVL